MMSPKLVALLFVIYFAAAAIYGALHAPHYDLLRIIIWAIGYAFVTYVISGALPFVVWAARGFKAAHAKSLFIPWAIIAVLIIIAGG
jgi:hypothetical protein